MIVASAALLLVAWQAPTFAQQASSANPRLVLSVVGCGEREEAVRAVVAVEVGDLLLERGTPATEGNDHLSVTCLGGTAAIEARAAHTLGLVRRELALGGFPGDAAARAVALAGLETLAEVSPVVQQRLRTKTAGKITATTVPHPPDAAAIAPPTPVLATTEERPSLVLTLSGAWRGFGGNHGAALWGAGAAVDRGLGTGANVEVDLEFVARRRGTELGTVGAGAFSLGAFWGPRLASPRIVGTLGLGFRAGVVSLSGHAADDTRVAAASVLRPWGGPALRARLLLGWGRWVVTAAAELGMAVQGAEGVVNGDTAFALAGPWLAIGAGFGIRR